MIFSSELKSNLSKISYLSRVKKLLIDDYNVYGDKFKNGDISEAEFNDIRNDFERKAEIIMSEINKIKEAENCTVSSTPIPEEPTGRVYDILEAENIGRESSVYDSLINLKEIS